METNIFGNRLRILLEEKDLEGKEFAKIIHVQPPTVSNWLNGNRFPNQDTLRKIADYFNVSVDFLLGRTEERNLYAKKIDTQEEADALAEEIFQILIDTGELSEEELQSGKIDPIKKMELLARIRKSIEASQIYERK